MGTIDEAGSFGWIFGRDRRASATFLVERREASDGHREPEAWRVCGDGQRYGVNADLLFTWRRQEAAAANGGAERVKLLPVTVAEAEAPTASPVAAPEPMGRMEILLSGGERIIVGVDVDATALARVVRTLTRR
jgi:hypothetical protein